jgi:LysR family nitrogen assimilation transcriptional regulator
MDTKHLRYFLAISESGSISRAATALGVAQPSLSQMLLRLEEVVGTRLFERSAAGVVLTETGRMFAEHARGIIRQVDVALESVRDRQEQISGKVAFGLPSSLALVLGVPLVRLAHEQLKNVSLCVTEAMSGHILEWIEQGSIDLAFLYNASSLNHLANRLVVSEELYVIGKAGAFGEVDDRGIALRSVPLRRLGDYPLIMPTLRHGLRLFVENQAQAHGVSLNVWTEIDSLTQVKALVAENEGYSVLSESAIHPELISGQLHAARLSEPGITRTVHLVHNPSKPLNRAALGVEHLALGLMRRLVHEGRWLARLES